MKLDKWTRRWIRNRADEVAVTEGCRFDLRKACFFIWWVERYCKLYEGRQAGEQVTMHSIADQPKWRVPRRFDWRDDDFRKLMEARADWHLNLVENDEFIDWPYEDHMRIYGWQRFSNHYGRWVRRFRRAFGWKAKKQKKSPAIAYNALFQIAADGEQGNKVFLFSSDGNNARDIAGNHILAMVEQSPELTRQMKVWKNTMRVKHLKSRSYLQPASSADRRAKQAKHGYNGSIFVDEFHTVDKMLDTIVRGAGISREQPLHMCFSTAGLEIASYGKRIFDLCLDIQNSKSEITDIFASVHAAPQDLTPQEFAKDPMKYGRMANPSMGHTVDPAEFLSEYKTVKGDPVDLAEFFVLRLNVWQQLKSPAFNIRKWKKLGYQFSWEDFYGHPCWCGFDRSELDDLTALAFLFEWDDRLWLLVDTWLPEWKAEQEHDRCPYVTYAKEGWIHLVETQSITDQQLLEGITARNEQFDIQNIQYDPNRASILMNKVSASPHDMEPGLGLDVEIFRQQGREFHQIYEELKRLIDEEQIHHPNNQLININMENCRIKQDHFGFKRLIKPEERWRKIDIATATTMALRGYLLSKGRASAPVGEAYDNAAAWSEYLMM